MIVMTTGFFHFVSDTTKSLLQEKSWQFFWDLQTNTVSKNIYRLDFCNGILTGIKFFSTGIQIPKNENTVSHMDFSQCKKIISVSLSAIETYILVLRI